MFFKVMAQFVLPLFLAAVLVVVFKPLHMWVRDHLPGRLRISALVTTILILLTVLLPMAFLGWNAYLEGRSVFNYLKDPQTRTELVTKLENTLNPFLNTYANFTAPVGDAKATGDSTEDSENTPHTASDSALEANGDQPAVAGGKEKE